MTPTLEPWSEKFLGMVRRVEHQSLKHDDQFQKMISQEVQHGQAKIDRRLR